MVSASTGWQADATLSPTCKLQFCEVRIENGKFPTLCRLLPNSEIEERRKGLRAWRQTRGRKGERKGEKLASLPSRQDSGGATLGQPQHIDRLRLRPHLQVPIASAAHHVGPWCTMDRASHATGPSLLVPHHRAAFGLGEAVRAKDPARTSARSHLMEGVQVR